MVGVPYAKAGVTALGRYYVTCPSCGLRFFADRRSDREDTETKGAARNYALHYQEVHSEQA